MANPRASMLLVIEGTYPWYRGGVSEWIHQYIRYFSDIDFNIVQIATDQYRGRPIEQALYTVPSHVSKFLRIPPPEIKENYANELDSWLQVEVDDLYEAAVESDWIHVTNTGFAGWLGTRLARKTVKPLILTEHALYWKEVEMGAVALECGYRLPEDNGEPSRESVTRLFKDIAAEVYEASDKVISVSRCNMDHQQALGAKNPSYIPNGVDETWLVDSKVRKSPLTIGWIGRCAEMKNPLKFLDIAESLSGKARFLMLLCEANEPELKSTVINRAASLPHVELVWNRPAIENIDRMDAICITSNNESQPLVLFEALSRKILPFGWRVGDVDERYAIAADDDVTPASLGEMIKALWSDAKRWEAELDKRFKRVVSDHTWQSVFERYASQIGRISGVKVSAK